jgi:hypothetical protein
MTRAEGVPRHSRLVVWGQENVPVLAISEDRLFGRDNNLACLFVLDTKCIVWVDDSERETDNLVRKILTEGSEERGISSTPVDAANLVRQYDTGYARPLRDRHLVRVTFILIRDGTHNRQAAPAVILLR